MVALNNIHHIECLDLIESMEDGSIDLAVLDPPYNMQKADWDTFKSHHDLLMFTYNWIETLMSKIKSTGSVYIFNTPYNSAFILMKLYGMGIKLQNWITWDKRDGLGKSTKKYSHGQETILFCTKTDKYTFNADAVRVPYLEETIKRPKGVLKNGKRWFPHPDGKLCGEVWHFSSQRHKEKIDGKTQKTFHITPKPHDMIERIIKASTNEGDLVFDCFSGSGTTALVANKLGRYFICGDSNVEYVNYARDRLCQEK